MFNGKIHYFDWAIFNSELLNYERVCQVIAIEHGPVEIVDLPSGKQPQFANLKMTQST